MIKIFQRKTAENELFSAIRKGNQRLVRKLIASGVSVECLDDKGRTPLCLAAKCADREIIRFLVESGADINGLAEEGRTPIYFAIYASSLSTVKLLIELGARLDIEDGAGYTPSAYAKMRCQPKMLDILKQGEEPSVEGSRELGI